MRKPKKSEPHVTILCRCGAQWHGRWALDNPIIDRHWDRCGKPVDAETFVKLGHSLKVPLHWKNEMRWTFNAALSSER